MLHGYPGVEPGLPSIRAFFEALWAAFPDVPITAEGFVEQGDKLACRLVCRGTHRGVATDRPIEFGRMTILASRDGRCAERWSQADYLTVLRQIGAVSL